MKGKITLNVLFLLDGNIRFTITDNGVGMSQETIEKLGEPFNTHQVKNLNKDGIGLGLYICNMIIESMGPDRKL